MDFHEFCQLAKSETLEAVVNSSLLEGSVFYFKGDLRRYFDFKYKIAEKLNVHPKDIEVVGSARLGFRLAQQKAGEPFGPDSDIDVVVVSNTLFEEVWLQLICVWERAWHDLVPKERTNLKECLKNVYWGYIRPERIPTRSNFSRWWWAVFEELSNCDDYEQRSVRGRLFKSWKHVQINYCYSIQRLLQELGQLSKERQNEI